MSEDQRKPWVLPVFFGLLIVLFWLVTDLMKPPSAAKVEAPAVDEPVAVGVGVTVAASVQASPAD